jgi:rhamnogalacturonan acetylesterase
MKVLTFFLNFSYLSSAIKIYLCGDSTMAKGNGKIDGWGQYLQSSMTIPVANKAIGGRSARSYTVEGRFNEVARSVQPGDFVVIEFGHNDGGSLANDNGRTDCPGAGNQTCQGMHGGKKTIVLTFPAYLINAGKLMASKGAKVVYSSMTPNNIWEGNGSYSPSRFTDYARQAAKAISGATFIDHGKAVANAYRKLGKAATNALYPQDHTHTSPRGAKVVADAFVAEVLADRNLLAQYVLSKR